MRIICLLSVLISSACELKSETAAPPESNPIVARRPTIQTLDNPGTLTEAELAAQPPSDPLAGTPFEGSFKMPEPPKPAIAAAQAGKVQLNILSETGYRNEANVYVVDLLERDLAYLMLKVETPDGRPVQGAKPTFAAKGSNALITSVSQSQATDETGMVEFGLAGQKMGAERVTVSYGDAKLEMLVNVISLKAAGYPTLNEVKGALRWEDLMKARLRFNLDSVEADFPVPVAAQHNKTVKLVGFMMPLEAEQKQKHFLLTSNPPSCFFHIPGGPAGAVEVFAEKGIEASWDPIILEGRFETVSGNEMGVIYRLRKARVVSK